MGSTMVEMGRTAEPVMFMNAGDSVLLEKLREAEIRIIDSGGRFNKVSMEIGWDGYFIKRNDGWRLLGYQDEKSFRHAMKIGRSTWYKVTGIAERLSHLSREEFVAMSIENAEQLSVQPMSAKRDPALIAKAQVLTAEELSDELVLATAERENKPVGEVYVTMKWRIRQAQREVIERGLEDWQHEHGIDDPGYGLELLVAEYRERPTLTGFLNESIRVLTEEMARVEIEGDASGLKTLFAAHIRDMREILTLCCGECRV